MAIILEGPDNSGKSTLGRLLARRLGLTLVESEGPPRYDGEINHRIERYLALPNPLFVRHPCVSQVIYGQIKGGEDSVDKDLLLEFYGQGHFFVYCDPLNRRLEGHVIKRGHDNKSHLRALENQYDQLLELYRQWAVEKAHAVYRIGDPVDRVVRLCSTLV